MDSHAKDCREAIERLDAAEQLIHRVESDIHFLSLRTAGTSYLEAHLLVETALAALSPIYDILYQMEPPHVDPRN